MDDCLCGIQVSSGESGWRGTCVNDDNGGVLRRAGCVQKSLVDQKEKSLLDVYTFSKNTDRECSCQVGVVFNTTTRRPVDHQHDNMMTS